MKRCAIYTRKSTEEGLDQEFNSLDAQREACEAYILSQRHDGWRAVRQRFDDGGYSGGTLDRPAMRQLMELIRKKQIDVVVVYKVDRLTRSLADFAKIVELMDGHGVSFVSVTQQFNTTTSMGRLTLNVLLSFAQFEREVTAERIRDKIASSKQKGMWMGGNPPLGYDVKDRALVVNAKEVKTVRMLFHLYLELGTVRKLRDAAIQRGLLSKLRHNKHGRISGGTPFSRGHLYHLLSNPIYVGKVAHKDKTYPGQHKAIIDEKTWAAVQARLALQAPPRQRPTNTKSPSFLAGLAFDETGDRLTPVHTTKEGRRYRYYISQRITETGHRDNAGWRIRAETFEEIVTGVVRDFLGNRRRLCEELGATEGLKAVQCKAGTAREQLRGLVERVELRPDSIAVQISRRELSRRCGTKTDPEYAEGDSPIRLSVPLTLRRRGVETKLVLRDAASQPRVPDPNLCRLVAEAHVWFAKLASGEAKSVRDLAQKVSAEETVVSRALPLAFLAPDVVEAILAGRQPIELTSLRLRRASHLPGDWAAQRRLLGFSQQ